MAVYTNISDIEVEQFLSDYEIGSLRSLKGIAEGVENSNYLLVTDQGQYILTLYEKRVEEKDLPFFLGLMEHLADNQFACPRPVQMKNGETLNRLKGKSAAIIEFIDGVSTSSPDLNHCEMIGEAAAKLHAKSSGFSIKRVNALGQTSWQNLFENSRTRANEVQPDLSMFLQQELLFQKANWPANLPSGVAHADLFPDNVFFLNGKLNGVIDYYFSANDFLALDIAICINAWCFENDRVFNSQKSAALLRGYQSVRKLEFDELNALPVLCRGTALRFLLTRLYDWLNVPPGALVVPHDPKDYISRLKFHQSVTSFTRYLED